MARKVMIVDNSGSLRAVVKLALQRAGHGTLEAVDGPDACGKLKGERIDLIVCDLHLPGMDGLAFIRHLQASARHRRTPVVVRSTESQPSKVAEGKAAGARAWITKPCHPRSLVDAVKRLCTCVVARQSQVPAGLPLNL